jgi:hypothetical protein
MIDAAAVGEIITQYKKHGWSPRRALLSAEGRSVWTSVIVPIEIIESDIDAIWFSRRSNPGSEAWELRRIAGLPFALIAVVSTTADTEEVESTLSQVVEEMRERTIA